MICKRDLSDRDVERVYDPFSESESPRCRYCHRRLIRLIGFAVDWLHDWRKIENER